jgi:hypothetical protein
MEAIKKNTSTLLDEAISYVNDKIQSRAWHNNFADPKDIQEKYYAIIITPYNRFPVQTIKETVKEFKSKGWDFMWRECYDARGPHSCFYVAKTDIYQ